MVTPPNDAGVLDALRPIVDPDFGKSIVELGFVKNLAIDGGRVRFTIELTTPACPVKEQFEREARERVLALPGVDDVEVEMTANTRGRAAARSGPTAGVLPGVRNPIAVASGKYDNPDEPGDVTHFQALTTALSATVGIGNIAGVAIAIHFGYVDAPAPGLPLFQLVSVGADR